MNIPNIQKNNFDQLVEIVKKTCKNIKDNYMNVCFAGDSLRHYRERVYAYEFYHQFRCSIPNNYTFDVSAEMDKRLNPLFVQRKIPFFIPDMIVHKMGHNSFNLAIIEIKSVLNKNKGCRITKDFIKIKNFVNLAQYFGGIELIYGENKEINKSIENIFQQNNELMKLHEVGKIVVLIHEKCNEQAYELKRSDY